MVPLTNFYYFKVIYGIVKEIFQNYFVVFELSRINTVAMLPAKLIRELATRAPLALVT